MLSSLILDGDDEDEMVVGCEASTRFVDVEVCSTVVFEGTDDDDRLVVEVEEDADKV